MYFEVRMFFYGNFLYVISYEWLKNFIPYLNIIDKDWYVEYSEVFKHFVRKY